tara:strand:- start:571 stop:1293 length:723 start_codon:yes stop_codon:yes gene_type:complete
MQRLLITRPKRDSVSLAEKLRKIGVAPAVQPMLNVRILGKTVPELDNLQALLVTSANGLRAFSLKCPSRKIRVLSVGEASAEAAKNSGFSEIESADGDVNDLVELVRAKLSPENGILLHPAGTEVAGNLGESLRKDGFDYQRLVLYEAQEIREFQPSILDLLDGKGFWGVLFFSPRTAKIFEDLLEKTKRDQAVVNLDALCLSRNVGQALRLNWKNIRIANKPNQCSLIETVESFRSFQS